MGQAVAKDRGDFALDSQFVNTAATSTPITSGLLQPHARGKHMLTDTLLVPPIASGDPAGMASRSACFGAAMPASASKSMQG